MTLIAKLLIGTFTCGAMLGISTECLAARNADECLTVSDLQAMDDGFWAHYPSVAEFSHYAASDMDIAGNIVDAERINSTENAGRGRAAQLASFLAGSPEYFSSFKSEHEPTYLYYVDNERRVDRMKATHIYPIGQCVSMFRFEFIGKTCIAGQRVRVLSLSFTKDSGKVELHGAQVAMDVCQ